MGDRNEFNDNKNIMEYFLNKYNIYFIIIFKGIYFIIYYFVIATNIFIQKILN